MYTCLSKNSSTYLPFCCQKCIVKNTYLVIILSNSWLALQSPINAVPLPTQHFRSIKMRLHSTFPISLPLLSKNFKLWLPFNICSSLKRLVFSSESLLSLMNFHPSFKVYLKVTAPADTHSFSMFPQNIYTFIPKDILLYISGNQFTCSISLLNHKLLEVRNSYSHPQCLARFLDMTKMAC